MSPSGSGIGMPRDFPASEPRTFRTTHHTAKRCRRAYPGGPDETSSRAPQKIGQLPHGMPSRHGKVGIMHEWRQWLAPGVVVALVLVMGSAGALWKGSTPHPPGIGNLPRLLADQHCRVAVLSPEAVAGEGRVVSQGAVDRIEIVPVCCIFRAVELPEIACGPGHLPQASLGDGRFARAGEVVVEVLVRHRVG